MNILRIIFLVIHIICAGLWISQFPVSLVFDRIRRGISLAELPAVRMTQGQILSILGQLGGTGIILSGFVLIFTDGYGLFNITAPTPAWLVVKQIFYVIAMVIVSAMIGFMPAISLFTLAR